MSLQYTITLDEENQIICITMSGFPTEESFKKHIDEVSEYVAELKDPTNVRILVDGRTLAKASYRVRKIGNKLFEDRNLKRVAMWGCNPVARTLITFFSIAFGEGKMKAFTTEDAARQWLVS